MHKRPLSEINVVPYIDVMLVLLVIFMITTPILTQGVNVSLPKGTTRALLPQQKAPIIVSIDNRGDYFLNISKEPYQPITTQDLVIRVTKALQVAEKNHQKQEVYIKGDKEIDYGKVVQIIELLQHAGANSVGLMTHNLS
ncbi:MAG: protein TolR [Coxiella endosymbiont of Haemaphysalis qinghaiensis]